MVVNLDDSGGGFPNALTMTVPAFATLNNPIGFRIRLSHTDNMTPYGRTDAGEVEDYFINLSCPLSICLPQAIEVKK